MGSVPMNYGGGDDPVSTSRSWKKGASAAGKSLSAAGQKQLSDVRDEAMSSMDRQNPVPSYSRGGKVRKTGLAKVHRGEYVVPKKKARKVSKLLRKKSRD